MSTFQNQTKDELKSDNFFINFNTLVDLFIFFIYDSKF